MPPSLLVQNSRIARFQVLPRSVLVYLRGLPPGQPLELKYRLRATMPVKINAPGARVYLYHIPQFTAVGIPLRVIHRLRAAYGETVAGIKDSSGDFENTKAILREVPGFEVFVGTEKFLLRNLQEGGKGCITATANVNAPAIVRAWRERSEEAQKRIDVVRNTYENYPMISALKETIARRTGDPQWRAVRPPLVELSDEQRSTLAA